MLIGTIPTEIAQLTSLTLFQVNDNDLEGDMPSEICLLRDTVNGPLTSLSSDCEATNGLDPEVECTCCTCCSLCS